MVSKWKNITVYHFYSEIVRCHALISRESRQPDTVSSVMLPERYGFVNLTVFRSNFKKYCVLLHAEMILKD